MELVSTLGLAYLHPVLEQVCQTVHADKAVVVDVAFGETMVLVSTGDILFVWRYPCGLLLLPFYKGVAVWREETSAVDYGAVG